MYVQKFVPEIAISEKKGIQAYSTTSNLCDKTWL